MWHWTFKSFLTAPLTLLASIAAAGGALLLAMLFEAVYAGEAKQVVGYVENADADVWVMQRGVSNMHMATSYLSDWKVNEVREVPGVAAVEPILYLNTVVDAGGKRWFSFVVGLDPNSQRAGPWSMATGRAQPQPGEAVVPKVFAEMTGLDLGDTVFITDHAFTVAGFSIDTFSMGNTVIFVTRPDLEDIMTSLDIVSFMLVKGEPGIDPVALAKDIEREVEKVHALPSEQFVINDKVLVMQMGVETIALMTAIGGALAILLVAFTIYSQVARQCRELAVVKALGATNRSLYISVAVQALFITLASAIFATGLALALMQLTAALIPQVTLSLTANAVMKIAVVGVGVALVASIIPARQIARVDPLSAFQA
ncbi:MAG: FtsX-like permease family protein [Burkholderiales bacterium]|nr:FtsX-like permease family protein [Burkholderiales bacterium]